MTAPVRVAVVGGGTSSEHDVSLASAAAAAGALRGGRFDVVPLTIARDGRWCADGWPMGLGAALELLGGCDVVLPMVHGRGGEDGTLAALCESAGVRYVGSGIGAGALAMDKWATKLVAASLGLGVAAGVLLTDPDAGGQALAPPVVVKPVSAGSSHGVTLVRRGADLGAAIRAAFELDDRVLVEELVVGREIDVAVLGRPGGVRVVAPALEIVCDGVFDARAKYGGQADFRVPAALDAAALQCLEDAAVRVYDTLGCRGVARVDFFLTADGPVLNEVNTTPGFTPASQVPRMFAAAGIGYRDLLEMLVDDALEPAGPAALPLA
ncbi:D-alanine--D-alanine ligase [Modestobacter sp. I12A-02628]|uniref:D-alanine--D-alanine ligase n=1 Tax=Goekera deserti TaxID=2497753 RepID=A0A7K3WGP8_9ACTN|nr:D-alanine--D-alanine ligase [Goekera deserti]MPQ99362.1 D-alanine--D-alanine ligase [Goekera deserti]NDI50361.1 D-alanine--D-alanine ligase [Goekera deserti]NEL55681.1 D-alanine--D-alanine ligase [Goekera deserti]